MQFRQQRGDLEESMGTLVTLKDRDALFAHCQSILAHTGRVFERSTLKIERYGGPDARIGWEKTFIVLIDGWGPVGFSDSAR